MKDGISAFLVEWDRNPRSMRDVSHVALMALKELNKHSAVNTCCVAGLHIYLA